MSTANAVTRCLRSTALSVVVAEMLRARMWSGTLPSMDSSVELHLRELIFQRLSDIVAERGVVTRRQLEALQVGNETRRIIDQSRGIWNPKDFLATLSVVSSPDGPYADSDVGESLFSYDYRAGSTDGDNRKMRRAYELALPIILLRKISTGVFVPVFPVYVVGDDSVNRRFMLALDETLRFVADPLHLEPIERKYAERAVRQRLHQPEFRGRVMLAYEQSCSVCSLKHGKLLDAAHIIGDDKPHGIPVVENGLSMCKIHHAAYDANLLGISPDYSIRINRGLMDEIDGPMLRHGLQEMDGRQLTLPKRRIDHPGKERLAERFNEFRNAS
jgi:putative restriction endonuclease